MKLLCTIFVFLAQMWWLVLMISTYLTTQCE